jgi:hypothetical protein
MTPSERALIDWREDNPRNPYPEGTEEHREYQERSDYLFQHYEEGIL